MFRIDHKIPEIESYITLILMKNLRIQIWKFLALYKNAAILSKYRLPFLQ